MASNRFIFILMAASALCSCSLKNDMQLPKDSADITAFEVYDQESSKIDAKNRTVTVTLSEDAYVNDLNIKTVKFSDGTRCNDPKLADGRKIDLTSPYVVTLSIFRDYKWTISATQPVERYVKCEKQVGDATIFPDTRKISLVVDTDKNSYIDSRTKLVINDMKLGLTRSRITSTKDYYGKVTEIESFPVTLDCFYERTFYVEQDGETQEWTMIVLPADQ